MSARISFTKEALGKMTILQQEALINFVANRDSAILFRVMIAVSLPTGYLYVITEYDGDRNDYHCGIDKEGGISS